MDKNQTLKVQSNKRLFGILIGVTLLLFIPLLAMVFTNEVQWTMIDFIVAGVLLLSAGLTVEFILRKVKTTKLKLTLIIVLFFIFFLIWAELAVGIFGTPFAGN
ncbi:MAG: hypothetical protein QM535_10040 [Limnohabitans sp.]|nr:hypothetical protein [Limnohabitans sp.]